MSLKNLLNYIIVGLFFVPIFASAAAFPYATGGTGTTTPNVGQLAYWGRLNMGGVATTTAGCSGGTSCSGFVVIGSTPITISSTAPGASFNFSADTNFGVQVYSTSTPTLWFKSGLYASSTSIFTTASSTSASSTGETTNNFWNNGITSALSLFDANHKEGSYAGSTCGANTFTTAISAIGGVTCAQVSLTAGVTGILPIANGGTATSTFYNGGVTFYNSSLGTLSQGTAQSDFFYDVTNKRLGLGTSTPWALLSVNPDVTIGANPAFVIGSSTKTTFLVTNSPSGVSGGAAVAINTTLPTALFDIVNESSADIANFREYNSTFAPVIGIKRALGTVAAPTALLLNSTVGDIFWQAYDGTTFDNVARIRAIEDATTSAGVMTGAFSFLTTNTGGSAVEALRITNAQKIGIGTSTPWGLLSVNPDGITGPSFAIGSSTKTWLQTTNGGQTRSCETVYGKIANGADFASSTSMTINFANTCNQVLLQIGTSATTVTISGATVGDTKRILVVNPGTTAGAVTFSGVVWIGGTTPTQTTTANGGDIYSCVGTQATSTANTSVKVECTAGAGLQ